MHELNVHFPQAGPRASLSSSHNLTCEYVRVSSRWDEVKKSMNPVVAEAGVTLDTRLLRENIIILALEVPNDFLETKSNRLGKCSN